MSKYADTHKRISDLDLASDDAGVIVGPRGGSWTTALSPTDSTDDRDYSVNGSRIAALTEGGVLYANQLPGAYGHPSYVMKGRMGSDGFYQEDGTGPVTPSVSILYVDVHTTDKHDVAYRWIESSHRYVVCPNTFRQIADYGLSYMRNEDMSHRSAWLNVDIGDNCLPADSADDPDSAGTKSLSENRTIGFDADRKLSHSAQPLLKEKYDADKGSLTVSEYPGNQFEFGDVVNTASISNMTHVTDLSLHTVTIPESQASVGYCGILELGDTGDISGIGGDGSFGTSVKAAAYDHVHPSGILSVTAGGRNAMTFAFSDTSPAEFQCDSILDAAVPPKSATRKANTVLRTYSDSSSQMAWGSMSAERGCLSCSLQDITFIPDSSGRTYTTDNYYSYSDNGSADAASYRKQYMSEGGSVRLDTTDEYLGVYLISGNIAFTVRPGSSSDIYSVAELKLNSWTGESVPSESGFKSCYTLDMSHTSTIARMFPFEFMYRVDSASDASVWLSLVVSSEDAASGISVSLSGVRIRQLK